MKITNIRPNTVSFYFDVDEDTMALFQDCREELNERLNPEGYTSYDISKSNDRSKPATLIITGYGMIVADAQIEHAMNVLNSLNP